MASIKHEWITSWWSINSPARDECISQVVWDYHFTPWKWLTLDTTTSTVRLLLLLLLLLLLQLVLLSMCKYNNVWMKSKPSLHLY